MTQLPNPQWREFIRTTGLTFTKAAARSVVLLPVAIYVAVVLALGLKCLGGSEPHSTIACGVLKTPQRILWDLLLNLYWILALTLIPLSLILYLEWRKYKEDKPSGFTHEWGCEGPPGFTRRLQWVQTDFFEINGIRIHCELIFKEHRRYAVGMEEDQLMKYLRRRFVRTENKPIEDTEFHTRWRIVQNTGTEVHVRLSRPSINPSTWRMETEFYEWAGRRQPPKLTATYITDFVIKNESTAATTEQAPAVPS